MTVKNVSTCIRFFQVVGNEILQKYGFHKLPNFIKYSIATQVSNVYNRNVLELLKNRMEAYKNAANLQFRSHTKKNFKRHIKTGTISNVGE